MKAIERHLENIVPLEVRSREYENIVIALRSIIGEHLDTENDLAKIYSSYSTEEISRAFNPPELIEDITYSPEEVLRRAEILALYYRIKLPEKLTIQDFEQNLRISRAPYLLNNEILDETNLRKNEIDETEGWEIDPEEDELSLLEKEIITAKQKFLEENALKSAKFLGIPEEVIKDEEKANHEINDLFNYIKFQFDSLDPNIQIIYFKFYERFLPVNGIYDGRAYYELFDTKLLEFNPSEYIYILSLLEEIRKTLPVLRHYNNWYEAFKKLDQHSANPL